MKISRQFKQKAIGILTGLFFNSYSDLEALREVLAALVEDIDKQLGR